MCRVKPWRFLSECMATQRVEGLPRESWSINSSACVIHSLRLGGGDESNVGGAESEIKWWMNRDGKAKRRGSDVSLNAEVEKPHNSTYNLLKLNTISCLEINTVYLASFLITRIHLWSFAEPLAAEDPAVSKYKLDYLSYWNFFFVIAKLLCKKCSGLGVLYRYKSLLRVKL